MPGKLADPLYYAERFLLMKTQDAFEDLMENCVVATAKLRPKVNGHPQKLAFTVADHVFTAKKDNAQIPFLMLRDAVGSEPAFASYVCDYQDGRLSYVMLGQDADYCFTATMNGCTFGIGSPTEEGDVLVSHGNAKGLVAPAEQADKQTEMARYLHGPNGLLLEPTAYRQNKEVATTFGMRVSIGWKFFYQSYRPTSGVMVHLGIHPIDKGTTRFG